MEQQRQKIRQQQHDYQERLRKAALQTLGGKCAECEENDFDVLEIDEHDKTLSWSRRYKAIIYGGAFFRLLCSTHNRKKCKTMKEATGPRGKQ